MEKLLLRTDDAKPGRSRIQYNPEDETAVLTLKVTRYCTAQSTVFDHPVVSSKDLIHGELPL
uniref:Uncharacterized protein n=1 Tax=Romanomermis culicivorax TaxID=13658 RepID=A0A915L8Y1_ROMCU